MLVAAILLTVSLLASLYAWVGYPVVLMIRSKRSSRAVWPRDIEPSVSVIIPAHNRVEQIAAKLENTLALDYAPDRLEILVASDGSTDGTDAVVERFADQRVRLLALPRRGKLIALQQAGRRARGDVLVFTDVNVALDPGALRHLVRPLADILVGGVCGARKVRRPETGDSGALGAVLLARFEDWIKRLESRLGSVYAADAGLYAIRRSLFVPATNPAQADDIAISARIVLGGKRLVYEPRAVCRKVTASDSTSEFRRQMNVANYSFRALLDLRHELVRRHGYGWQLFSHTIARDLVPVFLAVALFSSAFLSTAHALFAAILGVQVLFHSLAYAGWRLRHARLGRWPLFAVPFFFVAYNGAGLLGVLGAVHGIRPVGATRTGYHSPFLANRFMKASRTGGG
ncbi:MAG: glycosyltransferase [Longimicrobiales bacterium]